MSWLSEPGWFQEMTKFGGRFLVFGTQMEEKRLKISNSSLILTSNVGQFSWLEPFEAGLDWARPVVSTEVCVSSNFPSSKLRKQTKKRYQAQPTKTSNIKNDQNNKQIPNIPDTFFSISSTSC